MAEEIKRRRGIEREKTRRRRGEEGNLGKEESDNEGESYRTDQYHRNVCDGQTAKARDRRRQNRPVSPQHVRRTGGKTERSMEGIEDTTEEKEKKDGRKDESQRNGRD
ncbi:high mobility group nucleosome-binding domain-containing protein 5-like [Temnothorax curvispinosus]|uniref:High mobility group nucleosome-binding domain-containing protein 5-like n=1 Tax=Temnothorax curvispinosus TaxID=300111 RepID=A0A6J1Q7Z5_9HYME|nr:high mobility group nucleosome-binding domain-containing protein 5-like [Temnothorax curvispinosus]